ncbi:hypothetical protein D1641_03955 [Colidextribacter sp. OB.20]|uniref:hypothetical protein n=1 Tax=Colidextribacter sp. OB.20 TaxID=2304568 RepID=UPI00137026FD|nr:hypothetical protein [Colidextribacter sp. OB.20]NBI09174.1 hypothetical protein [Colidextribacter sp. OB.20]
MKKKVFLGLIVLAIAAAAIQIVRYSAVYPVTPVPLGKGVGSTLYIASCEPYSSYLELMMEQRHWIYLFQAPLEGEDFDPTIEMTIFKSSAGGPTYQNILYGTETFRVTPGLAGAELLAQDTLLWRSDTHIQKKLNALAPQTSEENPLYLVWCGGNLYGVIDRRAYFLWQGKEGKHFLLSLPEFRRTDHTSCVVTLGPITEDDYYEYPATAS